MDRADTSGFRGVQNMDYTCFKYTHNIELNNNEQFGDTALCLNCFSYDEHDAVGGSQKGQKVDLICDPDDGCKLVLGLGPTPSAYCDDHCSSNGFVEEFSCQTDSVMKSGSLSRSKDYTISETNGSALGPLPELDSRFMIPVVDEGSTSARKSGGYMPSLLLAPRAAACTNGSLHQEKIEFQEKSFGLSENATTESSESRGTTLKRCSFVGCSKGARGSSGLCIGHGGGQRCQKAGCNKSAESRTAYCKAHGGGRRCLHLGCTKSAEGKTDYCIAHGGGRRCGYEVGCTKAARGKSGFCIRHGGGKRCQVKNCARSAEGQAGLCISHGGGRRCLFEGCKKGAQGSTKFCKAHGGGKRCIFGGCTKGAEGSTPLCKRHGGGKRCLYNGGGICPKSVHGGTNFCVAHGGGKRCTFPGCTKSARGRTDCCVKHGGGKRCKHDNCGKSAQGSTDFCKAHGGGKRCNWGEGKCEKFARGKSGLCAAHSSLVQERGGSKAGMLSAGLFHGVVSPASSTHWNIDYTRSSSAFSSVHDSVDSTEPMQHLIPPQVLVPQFMKSSSYSSFSSLEKFDQLGNGKSANIDLANGKQYMLPEGRVHGGGLMSFLHGKWNNKVEGP